MTGERDLDPHAEAIRAQIRDKAKAALSSPKVTDFLAACLRRGRNGEGVAVDIELADGSVTEVTDTERLALGMHVDAGDPYNTALVIRQALDRAKEAKQMRQYIELSEFQSE